MIRRNLPAIGMIALAITLMALSVVVPFNVPAAALGDVDGVPAACFGHPGIEYQDDIAYLCVFKTSHNGELVFTQTKYAFQYYYHPLAGDMFITETYFKPNGSRWLGMPPLVTPYGLPVIGRSDGRLVTIEDGCLVVAPSTRTVPTDCTSTDSGGSPTETHQMTDVEQKSVADFWAILRLAVPDIAR